MLLALTKENKLIDAREVDSSRSDHYYCPTCKNRVFTKNGKYRISHFSHYSQSNCKPFSEGETLEHLSGKRFLAKYFEPYYEQVVLEAYLPELDQRPDLLLIDDDRSEFLAIEFQCSPIPHHRLIERTKGYVSAGYQVLWIVGSPLHLDKKLTSLHRAMLNEAVMNEPNLLSLDIQSHQLKVHYNFRSFAQVNWTTRKLDQFPKGSKKLDISRHTSTGKLPARFIDKQVSHLKRQHYHKTPKYRQFFQLMYENKDHILALPEYILYPCQYDWAFLTLSYEWKYQLYIWLKNQDPKSVITLKMLAKWYSQQVKQGKVTLYDMPGVQSHLGFLNILEYVEFLTEAKFLVAISQHSWQKNTVKENLAL